MSQSKLCCTNDGDEPMKNIWWQLDSIQMGNYFADSCAISSTAFLFILICYCTCLTISCSDVAMWFHNVISLEFGIAVNVFWRHLEEKFYDHKDTYGNKDLVPGSRAMQVNSNLLLLFYAIGILKRVYDYRKTGVVLVLPSVGPNIWSIIHH